MFNLYGRQSHLAVIPFGAFVAYKHVADSQAAPETIRSLPVLLGCFEMSAPAEQTPGRLGVTDVEIGGVPALAVLVQLGRSGFCWLANPADAEVWRALNAWIRANHCLIRIQFSDGGGGMATSDFFLPPELATLRARARAADIPAVKFVNELAECFARGDVEDLVLSAFKLEGDLEELHVQLLATGVTGPVAVVTGESKTRKPA